MRLPASVVVVVNLPRKPAAFITLIIHNLLSLKEDLLHQDLFRIPTKIYYEAKWQRLLRRAHFDVQVMEGGPWKLTHLSCR